MTTGENNLQGRKASDFSILMENLDMLEATFSDSYVGRLEREILGQLERLGALKLFHACLSKTLKSPTFFDFSDMPTQLIKQPLINETVDVHVAEIVVRSRKKEERKSRRGRASQKASLLALPSKIIQKGSLQKRPSNSRSRRLTIAKNEAEMSRQLKVVSCFSNWKSITIHFNSNYNPLFCSKNLTTKIIIIQSFVRTMSQSFVSMCIAMH